MNINITDLESKAREIRYSIVKMVGPGQAGHFGGSCSLAEIIAVLYFYKMRHDPKNPGWEGRDRLILSKGHAAVAQYAALAMCGYFPAEELPGLKKLGAMLQGHPDMARTPGIEANTGSLGQGLSIACGMAAGIRLDFSKAGKAEHNMTGHSKSPISRIYCVVGDGELAEGQIWEAAMAASFYRLDNLTGILDCNRLQATGPVAERFDTNPHKEKWEAFGWKVLETDGHSIEQIISSLEQADQVKGRPVMIIAHTVKGKGIPFAENNAAFHNGIMSEEQFELACGALCGQKYT
ncbi:MAG: transketolase [Eubacteriales bacterium]|nr:transketolase [Eubacteriales bacterium]